MPRLLPLPAFDDNYIWLLADDASHAVVVDPGDAAVVFAAADAGLQPQAVLITHHHSDHIGGLPALLARWPDLPVFAPDDTRIDLPCRRVGDGEQIIAGGHAFTVMAVPGHTRTHIAYYGIADTQPILFCGDTLFSLGCGRLFEGTPAQMLASLDAIAALPEDTLICCAHEYTLANAAFAQTVEPDNLALRARVQGIRALREAGLPSLPVRLADERATNPFLRSDHASIRQVIAQHRGYEPADRLQTFTELRRWKDVFRG